MASSSRLQDDVDLSGRAPGPEDDELYGSNAPASGLEPTAEILDSQGQVLLPSAELWFPEGDVILLCEGIGFRVDKQSLVTHSEIFNDLFVNGGMTVDERAQDCDLIRLPDGSAEIFHMLKALHYETYVKESPDIDAEAISQLLHLSNKYMMNVLRIDAVEWLQARFPITLKEYQAIPRVDTVSDDYKVEMMRILQIGEEYPVPAIVPAAYYACSLMPTEDLFDGVRARNGDIVKLSPSALCTTMLFREKMAADKIRELYLRSIFEAEWLCPQERKTRSAEKTRGECLGAAWEAERDRFQHYGFDLFNQPLIDPSLDKKAAKPCVECAARIKAEEEHVRWFVWKQLPHYCGRANWRKIQLQQIAADKGEPIP